MLGAADHFREATKMVIQGHGSGVLIIPARNKSCVREEPCNCFQVRRLQVFCFCRLDFSDNYGTKTAKKRLPGNHPRSQPF